MKKLMEKIKKFNFFGNRTIFYIVPLVVVLVMIVCGLCYQLGSSKQYFANIGIDFQGGTILTIEFKDSAANSANYKTNVEKITQIAQEQQVTISRNQSSGDSSIIVQYTNWNTGKGGSVNSADDMNDINTAIQNKLYDMSQKGEIDEIVENGVNFSTIGNESSKNLIKTSAIAVAIALVLMLLYIIIRFDFYSGLAAVIALLHDVIIMISLTIIFYVEIGDSIVAGLITIVAYSINNTIVVFDRIRSVVKPLNKQRKKYEIEPIINNAITSTMTRTLYTTITTLVVMIVLVAMGVASIITFGLPIIFGLIAGFYSSVFIAAPLWGEFKSIGEKIKIKRANKKFKKKQQKA
jgi:preprotein translocase subunit SecF